MTADSTTGGPTKHSAGLFDVRNIIAALMGIYGVVLFVMGLVHKTAIDRQNGINLNVWCGLGMFIFAVIMAGWAYLRPILVDEVELDREKAAAELENPHFGKD